MSEWKEYRFSDFVEISPQVNLKQGSTYSFVEMADLQDGNKFCDASTIRPFNGSGTKFRDRDTLFARITPCLENGKICQVRNLTNNTGFGSTEFYVFRGREGVSDTDFIFYLARWPDVRDYAEANFHGTSGRQRVPRESFDNFFLKLPPLPEQCAIAGVLSSLDDKIDLLHQQNRTLEGMAEALWRKMFVEEADVGWKKGKLDDLITSLETGRRPKGGIDPNLTVGVPSIGAESINGLGNYDFGKTKYITEEYYNQMNSGKIQNYDILIYKDGAYIGKKSMFANGFPFEKCCINEHVFILRTGEVNSQLFLYFVLEQEELEQLNANSAQPGLNQEALKSFEIIYPDKDLIDDFGSKAKPLIDKIFMNSVQTHSLSRLRDTLLPKLISGEMRVKL